MSTEAHANFEGGREDTYLAWNGKSYLSPPPEGWFRALDGRWWPEPQEPDSQERQAQQNLASEREADQNLKSDLDRRPILEQDSTRTQGKVATIAKQVRLNEAVESHEIAESEQLANLEDAEQISQVERTTETEEVQDANKIEQIAHRRSDARSSIADQATDTTELFAKQNDMSDLSASYAAIESKPSDTKKSAGIDTSLANFLKQHEKTNNEQSTVEDQRYEETVENTWQPQQASPKFRSKKIGVAGLSENQPDALSTQPVKPDVDTSSDSASSESSEPAVPSEVSNPEAGKTNEAKFTPVTRPVVNAQKVTEADFSPGDSDTESLAALLESDKPKRPKGLLIGAALFGLLALAAILILPRLFGSSETDTAASTGSASTIAETPSQTSANESQQTAETQAAASQTTQAPAANTVTDALELDLPNTDALPVQEKVQEFRKAINSQGLTSENLTARDVKQLGDSFCSIAQSSTDQKEFIGYRDQILEKSDTALRPQQSAVVVATATGVFCPSDAKRLGLIT